MCTNKKLCVFACALQRPSPTPPRLKLLSIETRGGTARFKLCQDRCRPRQRSTVDLFHGSSHEFVELGRAEAGGRVPAGDGIEAVVGGAALVVRAEADVLVAVGARVEVRVGRALTLTLALALALALPLVLALAQTWKPDGLR